MTRIVFVTGTDTGVGKTLVTAALCLALRQRGRRALAMKPVAAGCTLRDGRRVNEDALCFAALAPPDLPYESLNPVALAEPIAPHVAAAREGRTLTIAPLAAAVRAQCGPSLDVLLVEGAGGWLVPLNETESLADLAAELGAGVVLVVGQRLGCINHALLTAAAIDASGCALLGWIASAIDPSMDAAAENLQTLDARLPAPRLGAVPWLGPGASPAEAAGFLDPDPLWSGP